MRKFVPLAQSGSKKFDFLGGRRSGKTFFILQILLGRVLQGETVNVAVMTDTQGRLGAYSDIRTIIAGSPSIQPYLDVMSSPREVRCKNGGVMFFNSYAVSERAKGIACDWLFINEANNFTEQQYIDLSASVRKGCFADRNPNAECWSERNGFVLIHSTWKDNRDNLTALQIQWFEDLKNKAESPNATQLDIALYKMYYLGEYAEVIGNIFTPANVTLEKTVPNGLYSYMVFADPSALRGADYFAMVLGATDGERIYILDTFSVNEGGYIIPTRQLQDWQSKYPISTIYIETNGLQGIEFYEFASNSEIDNIQGWNSKGNKFERIVQDYQGLVSKIAYLDTVQNRAFVSQVYEFSKKCAHDDNIDAVNSLYLAYKWNNII